MATFRSAALFGTLQIGKKPVIQPRRIHGSLPDEAPITILHSAAELFLLPRATFHRLYQVVPQR